jgi:hypothetical protein
LGRVAELDDALAHHWAEAVLHAVRADDPLAFGVEALRRGGATYRADVENLINALPPDRRDALARAEQDLRQCVAQARHAD